MGKTMIAMSGGVDSSAAALLVQQQGDEAVGVTMHLFGKNASGNDVNDAKAVAEHLGLPFLLLDYSEEFRQAIIEPFVDEYLHGRTPNPCVLCNRVMKFDKLMDAAKEHGCDTLVTGHYARVEFDGEKYLLKKAKDGSKDQSYMLYRLTQEQLRHIRFPLGEYTKEEIRKIAEERGLVNARKKDSQDICFVPDGDYARVIEELRGQQSAPGPFVDKEGKTLGTHRGIIHYTVGQRRGLGISAREPLYVLKIEPQTNTVVLGPKEELFSRELDADGFHWISGQTPMAPVRARAKIRYHHKEEACTVIPGENGTSHIVFDDPQRAVTPGQSVVVYDGDTVLGGGFIR